MLPMTTQTLRDVSPVEGREAMTFVRPVVVATASASACGSSDPGGRAHALGEISPTH